ncbi:sugar ABC transporter ATP-binding protein [Inquilinus limosus]|uniref:Sugar ABC transporter ATP-binding protein n=1 Tax=Inquilinus limosus TaxID=171674 RepID=A0A211ZGJ7_9PROT|nr:sugar ABC transporter ATP-binding protein [Inquilinus limosus]OWJ64402.1 sugar ABC transporter ATP-binding protein [Inquilinus limosus]
MTGAAPRFEMRGIRKAFPGVVALDGVSFACRAGEIHALCGENGAGKSTLMKVLGGVHAPDAGEILVDGAAARFAHPAAAHAAGISIIHQELSLLPDRTVAENIHLGIEPVRRFRLDRAAMRDGARSLLARLSSDIDPDTPARDLTIAEQQTVEIAKALAIDARILVMDEPTAALDDIEAARLLQLVRGLKDAGVAVVYISHRMPEVFAIADTVTVLKDGRHVATRNRAETGADEVVRLMVGRPLSDYYPPLPADPPGEPVLRVEGGGNALLADIDLTVRRGEIVAVAGLEGSGKTALARAVVGAEPFLSGRMWIGAKEARPGSVRAALSHGLGLVPEDRKRDGLALMQSVRCNGLLARRGLAGLFSRPNGKAVGAAAIDGILAAVDVRAVSWEQEIRLLSGGNQQKAILARWLACDPQLLVFAEPTRGVDVAAKAAIYRLMRDFTARGRGILVATSDLPEALGLADRILVMREGRIVGERPGGATEEEVMALATGHRSDAVAAMGAA